MADRSDSRAYDPSRRHGAPELIPWPNEPMAAILNRVEPGAPIQPPDMLFAKITDEQIALWEQRFGGAEASG